MLSQQKSSHSRTGPHGTDLQKEWRGWLRRVDEEHSEGHIPAGYSITSPARCQRNQGTSRPSVSAVLRLITSSNFSGTWTEARSVSRR
jgi:hypothetical protein